MSVCFVCPPKPCKNPAKNLLKIDIALLSNLKILHLDVHDTTTWPSEDFTKALFLHNISELHLHIHQSIAASIPAHWYNIIQDLYINGVHINCRNIDDIPSFLTRVAYNIELYDDVFAEELKVSITEDKLRSRMCHCNRYKDIFAQMNVAHLVITLNIGVKEKKRRLRRNPRDNYDWSMASTLTFSSLKNIFLLLSASSIFDNLKSLRINGIQRHECVEMFQSLLRKGIRIYTDTTVGTEILSYAKLTMLCEDRIMNPDSPPIYTLDLRKHNLHALPESIFALRELEVLRLNDNNLTMLPAGIGALSNLKILDLEGNNLHSLPYTIGALHQLEHLYLRENPNLREIPSSVLKLPHVYIHHELQEKGDSIKEDLEMYKEQYRIYKRTKMFRISRCKAPFSTFFTSFSS